MPCRMSQTRCHDCNKFVPSDEVLPVEQKYGDDLEVCLRCADFRDDEKAEYETQQGIHESQAGV